MNSKLFLGLTFFSDNSFAKSTESFRARFDSTHSANPELFLPIVPPFEIESTENKKLHQELVEELESFFFENTADHTLGFSGLDVYEHSKNKLLHLNPILDEEFVLFQESLVEICQSYISDREKKIKDQRKPFLTIGSYQDSLGLHSGIELAKLEFQEFTTLAYKSICLFSKNNGIWYRQADLITFERPTAAFAQNTPVSL